LVRSQQAAEDTIRALEEERGDLECRLHAADSLYAAKVPGPLGTGNAGGRRRSEGEGVAPTAWYLSELVFGTRQLF